MQAGRRRFPGRPSGRARSPLCAPGARGSRAKCGSGGSAEEAGGCGRRRRGAGRGGRDSPAASRAHLGEHTRAHAVTSAQASARISHPPHARAHVRTHTARTPTRADTLTRETSRTRTRKRTSSWRRREPTVGPARGSLAPPDTLPPGPHGAHSLASPSFAPSPQDPSSRLVAMATRLPPQAPEHPPAPPPQREEGVRPSAPASVGAGPEGWGLEIRSGPGSHKAGRSDPPAVRAWDLGAPSPAGGSGLGGGGGLRLGLSHASSLGLLRGLCW